MPHPVVYAIAVSHDVDGDNNSSWSAGGGFSRNPHISLLHLRPSFGDVAVNVGQGVLGVNVILNYRYGLSIHPANSASCSAERRGAGPGARRFDSPARPSAL